MDKTEMRKMMGIDGGERTAFYKLNKVQMSGDTGDFKLSDLLTEREKGQKPDVKELGKELDGVILKMRWALSKYDEPNNMYYSSTEYDDKWRDQITVFPNKDKGSVETMKAKYGLSTQRIVYMYLPSEKQIVRLIVKASALSGDKNPNGELGLFEYIDEYISTEILPCENITVCTGVFREGKNQDGTKNKRKDHYAMSFKAGRKLTETEFEKVQKMLIEVAEKTNTAPPPVEEMDESAKIDKAFDEAFSVEPNDEINPEDVPF